MTATLASRLARSFVRAAALVDLAERHDPSEPLQHTTEGLPRGGARHPQAHEQQSVQTDDQILERQARIERAMERLGLRALGVERVELRGDQGQCGALAGVVVGHDPHRTDPPAS